MSPSRFKAFSIVAIACTWGDYVLPNQREPWDEKATDKVVAHTKNTTKGLRRRKLQVARKGVRRNLGPKPPRQKNWTLDHYEEGDEVDHEQHERIMPIDEGARRQVIEQAAFGDPTAQPKPSDRRVQPDNGLRGIVISVSHGQCTVESDETKLQCHIRSVLSAKETPYTNAVAVGDEVIVSVDGAGGGIIEDVLPRRSTLTRPDAFYSHRRQVIVANADQVLIVSSWRDPFLWLELIDRCIIAAQRTGLLPLICVNKIDLVDDAVALNETLRPYESLGHKIIRTSVITGEGVEQLRETLNSKTTVLTGLSGTGKSSLISTLQPGLQLRTSDVGRSRKHRGQGQHTTTQVIMLRLESGGSVVDTPGIREFGLSGLHQHELASFFPEISALAPECRFSDCTHFNEPGCAVRIGATTGAVPASRYHSYRLIRDTL